MPADRGLVIDLKSDHPSVKCSYRPKRYVYDLCGKEVPVDKVKVDVFKDESGEQIRYLCDDHALI
jgi:hypothetical protein